jgi:hypothetical protein
MIWLCAGAHPHAEPASLFPLADRTADLLVADDGADGQQLAGLDLCIRRRAG